MANEQEHPLFLTNTLTRQKERFVPLQPPHVGLYVCGPTVYSDVHLGNVRSFLTFDVLVRWLRHLGYQVRYVRNITDVGHLVDDQDAGEDKIAKRARMERLEPMEIVQKYTNGFHDVMRLFNILPPSIEPTATGHLIEQIGMIGRILANGRPRQYASVGADVADAPWFQSAMRTRSGEDYGVQSVPASPLAGGERAMVYACTVRQGGRVDGAPLAVLGIVFRWDALAQTIVERTPLSEAEWRRSRVCIVDGQGQLLADTQAGGAARLEFPGRDALFAQPRGAAERIVDGQMQCLAHAASPGYETYRTGWHCVIVQGVG